MGIFRRCAFFIRVLLYKKGVSCIIEEKFMREAIKLAKKAASIGEVPIGAVIVSEGKIIARGYNKRETKQNALLHAEVDAISKACRKIGYWRLCNCEIYVTLEPCPMCMGAIISARIDRLYFGAYDAKSGAAASVCDLSCALPHKVSAVGGVLEEECSMLIKDFFSNLRVQKKRNRALSIPSSGCCDNKSKGVKNNEVQR